MQFVRKTMTGLSSCFLTRLPQSSHCKFVSSVSHLLVKVWSLARTVSSPPQTQNSRIVKLNCSTLIIQLHPLKLHTCTDSNIVLSNFEITTILIILFPAPACIPTHQSIHFLFLVRIGLHLQLP